MRETKPTVYGLVYDDQTVYIGSTVTPAVRERKHASRWRRQYGLAVTFAVIEEPELGELVAAERAWVEYGFEHDWPLTNAYVGGGNPFCRHDEHHSDEVRARQSASARQRPPLDAEARALISAKARERWADPVFKEKMAKAHQARRRPGPLSDEGRANISAAKRVQWADPDFRAMMLEAFARRGSAAS